MAARRQPRTRAQQAQETRDDVLKAARVEFERWGFEAANLRAIAKRAGVSAATVLHHLGDKRELLYAALFSDLDATLAHAFDGLEALPLPEALTQVAERVFDYYRRRPGLSRVLLKESLFAEGPWAARFVGQVTGVHQHLAAHVRRAVERGELRADTDAAMSATAWFSFFYFALIGWVQGSVSDPVALVGRLFEQHLHGLRPTSTPARGSHR